MQVKDKAMNELTVIHRRTMKPVKERIFEPFEEVEDLPPKELSIETSFEQTIGGSVKGKKVKKRVKKITATSTGEDEQQPKVIS